jgi:hypothetical protein
LLNIIFNTSKSSDNRNIPIIDLINKIKIYKIIFFHKCNRDDISLDEIIKNLGQFIENYEEFLETLILYNTTDAETKNNFIVEFNKELFTKYKKYYN